MRFMAMVIPKDYGNATPGALPDEKSIGAMARFNEELQKAGVLLALDGLHPPSSGARMRVTNGKREVTDGPFTEAREVVGGYWMLDVKNKEEAIEWMKRAPFFHDVVVDIRPVQEAGDFPASEAMDRERKLGEIMKAGRK